MKGHAHGRNHNAQSGTHSYPTCPSEPAPARIRVRWRRRPPAGPRQPCGPTLSPLLRTCQGHVSTLPNSEFLIMPNMVSPRRSRHTSGRGVAGAAGRPGRPGRTSTGDAKGGEGRGASGSAPRNGVRWGGPGAGRTPPGKRREEPRSASAGLSSWAREKDLVCGPQAAGRSPPAPPPVLILTGSRGACKLLYLGKDLGSGGDLQSIPRPPAPQFCPALWLL